MKTLKLLLITFLVTSALVVLGQVPSHEKIIKDYFSGWVKKDWKTVESQLANGFTFTSAAPDDHLSTAKFKEKCWEQAQHIKRIDFMRIVGDSKEAFAIVHVITNDDRVIRNVEYYNFDDGKIKSIEVFFGRVDAGFPTNGQ